MVDKRVGNENIQNTHIFKLLLCAFMFLLPAYYAEGYESMEIYKAEMLEARQIDNQYPFEYKNGASINLSGIGNYQGDFFVIGDKSHDPYLYKLKRYKNKWQIQERISLPVKQRPSFEGMFLSGELLIVVNEDPSEIIFFDFDGNLATEKPVRIDLAKYGYELRKAGLKNIGFEGVAFDYQSNRLYVAKEREPAYILELSIDMDEKKGVIEAKLDHNSNKVSKIPLSISDLYFEKGHLYVLERRDYLIKKIIPNSGQIVAQLNFSFLKDQSGDIYEGGEKYGLAEALVLTEDKIFVGMDNNGREINLKNRWAKEYHLNGNQPTIVTLKRPAAF